MLKRAMSSRQASYKKRRGRINERHFVELIGGDVVSGVEKTDVIDPQYNTYSVKSGEWWQIFLYGRERFVTNTEFQGIGNVANLIIRCIDVFPESQKDYKADKITVKKRLQPAMRDLCAEILKPTIFSQLLSKGIFNGDEVDYLSVLPKSLSDTVLSQKHFHVFAAEDVVSLLSTHLKVENTKAQNRNQMDALKVGFRYNNRRVGEIEIRTDRPEKYKLVMWRLNSPAMLGLLRRNLEETFVEDRQVSVYGKARNYL